MGILFGFLIGIFLVTFVVCPILAWWEDRIGYTEYIKMLFS